MQTEKNTSRSLIKILETIGLIIVPLVMVLMAGVLLRSFMAQPVVQAKNAPTPLPEITPTADVNINSASQPISPADVPLASFQSMTVNGVTVYAGNYRLQDGQLLVDVCFDMIDESDWMVWGEAPIADTQGYNADFTSSVLIELRHAPKLVDGKLKQFIVTGGNDTYRDAKPDKKIGQRCDTFGYDLPEKFDTSHFTLTIKNIARNPSELDGCQSDTEYLKKMQNALDKKKTGIKIKNKSKAGEGGGGQCGFEVTQKPADMTDAAAWALVSNQEMFIDTFGIRGPWVFEGSIK